MGGAVGGMGGGGGGASMHHRTGGGRDDVDVTPSVGSVRRRDDGAHPPNQGDERDASDESRLTDYDVRGEEEEDDDDDGYEIDDGLCSILPRRTPSTLSIWSSMSHHRIVNATQHSADHPNFIFRDFTSSLLTLFTPDRLQRSVKTLPLDWTPVERCMDVLHRRYESIRRDVLEHSRNSMEDVVPSDVMRNINDDMKHPRKLNVMVMGGSVTMGVVCHINPVTTNTGKYSRRACAWPGRMADFVTRISGGYDLVHFHTLALGGTNTESGSVMWDYSLLPDDMPYPDVVINAYATNDMHYNSVQDAIARNVTMAESLLSLGQHFVRQVLTPKAGRCESNYRHPPLLLYLDDYVGNEQNEVLTTMLSPQTIHLLSGYYGLGSMSYGDAIRDIKYGDTREWWFGANWYEGKDVSYGRGVHPHMGMHISMVWVVAYNLLNLVTTYCSLPSATSTISGRRHRGRRLHAGVEDADGYDAYRSATDGASSGSTRELAGGPRRRPRGIPPPLSPELSLENITELWNSDSDSNARLWATYGECANAGSGNNATTNDDVDDAPLPRPCVFSFVANLERFLDNPTRLTEKIGKYITSNNGWEAANDNNKLGWVPANGIGSNFTMEFKGISQPVRAVTWMIMRSYGDRWDGSMLNVEVWSGGTLLALKDIEGYHDKKTSETYNIKMRLDGVGIDGDDSVKGGERGAVVGSDLRIEFELVGGSTFKISGMAICDH